MLGSSRESAQPTVIFISKSRRQRTFAKALLKESKLLDCHSGVNIKTLDSVPMIQYAGEHVPSYFDDVSSNGVYMVDDPRGHCGSLVAFGGSRLATMGGVVLINGNLYGISVQHARLICARETGEGNVDPETLCFDDDSDAEDSDLVDITSKESISSDSDCRSASETFVTFSESSDSKVDGTWRL